MRHHEAGRPAKRRWAGGRSTGIALAFLLVACDRGMVTAPSAEAGPQELPSGSRMLRCSADVRGGSIRCEAAPPSALPPGMSADRVIGGQDLYVKLTSEGTAYDASTEVFRSTVRVQNLTRQVMGTSDGTTVEGLQVFFHTGPDVTSGTGSVAVRGADGVGSFTGSGQPYYQYGEILAPTEISAGRLWQFDVSPTVDRFDFTVLVWTPLVDESGALLGPVWTGAAGTSDWFTAENWDGGVPDSASTATVPSDSTLAGAPNPALSADARVEHLRVDRGSTLNLDGNLLEVLGNVDATGTVTNGTVRLAEGAELAGGSLPALEVAGTVSLQRNTTATGAVRITGSLHVSDVGLVIRIP